MKNALKEIWAKGQPVLNGWCNIANPFAAEIMAAQGFDSITIDMQHGAVDYSGALPMFQAMGASGKTLMARVPWREPGVIMKCLDAGCLGIICPMINNADEAAEFVSYMRYPPMGQRSFGPTRARFAFGDYQTKDANQTVMAFAMIETADGMANLEEICATKGLDGIYVGPSDLTLGLKQGAYRDGLDREEEDMISALQTIAETCKKHGLVSGVHCATPEYAARAIGWGFQMVTIGADSSFMASGANAAASRFMGLVGRDKSGGQDGGY